MPDKVDWARLAMAIDGEGFITISHSNSSYKPKNRPNAYKNNRFNVIVAVTNTDIRLMKWLINTFGHSFSSAKTEQNPKWKQRHVWNVCGNKNKEHVLLAIMPYLILKKEQANVALKFLRLPSERLPEERRKLCSEIHLLNKRGKSVETNTPKSSETEPKIESELDGNIKSVPAVTQNT